MTQSDFIGLVNGKPWANRACSFEPAGITEGLQQSGVHGAWCDMSYRGCLARRYSGER